MQWVVTILLIKLLKVLKLFLDKNKSKNDFILNIFGKEKELKKKLKKYNIKSNSIKYY